MSAGRAGRDLSSIRVGRWTVRCAGCSWGWDHHPKEYSKGAAIRRARTHTAGGHTVNLTATAYQTVREPAVHES